QVRKLPLDWVEWSMLALLFAIVMSMYIHGSYLGELKSIENAGEEKFKFGSVSRGFLIPFSAYFLARRGIVTWEQRRAFFIGIAGITLYLALTGFAEVGGPHWLVFPKYIVDPKVGIHFGSARGPFVNPAYNGMALAMALPILLWLFLNDRNPLIRYFALGTGVATIGVLPFVFQRGAWLGAAAALGVMVLAASKQRVLVAGLTVLIAAAGWLALPGHVAERLEAKMNKVETIEFRVRLAEISWEIIQDHPLTGIGFHNFRQGLEDYGAGAGGDPSHNTVLTLTVETGLLGLIPYLAIFAFIGFESFVFYLRHARYRPLIAVLWGVAMAYGVRLVASELRYVIYPNALMFIVAALILEAVRQQHQATVAPNAVRRAQGQYARRRLSYATWA
ncbi:MAG: O-antigen ligase family protein, partial [Thermodesulfobacteriota bacterium]